MLSAIAIDDEPIALEVVKKIAEKIPFLDMKGYFTNAFEAAEYLHIQKIDLIFLDIKMPDISGIDLIKIIPNPPMVIFTTAYPEHAVQSFELDAIDYLLKPFSQARFLKACNKAQEQADFRNSPTQAVVPESVFIKTGYEKVRVDVNEILYVESTGNYVQFVLTGRKITSRLTMSEAKDLLPNGLFVRIHRSYIVGKKQITRLDKNTVWIGPVEIPVGPNYEQEIQKLL